MKTLRHLLLLFGVLLVAWACSSDNPPPPPTTDSVFMEFPSTIGDYTAARAAGSTWGAGDQIGVFAFPSGETLTTENAVGNNREYKTADQTGNFTGVQRIELEMNALKSYDFTAYYPYLGSLEGISVPVSVATQTDQTKIDFMYSNNAKNHVVERESDNRVTMNFNHMLSQLALTITNENGDDLPGAVVTLGGLRTRGSFNLATGELTTENTSIGDIVLPGTFEANSGTAQGIVLPGNLSGATFSIVISTGRVWSGNFDALALQPGKRHTIPVTLNDDGSVIIAIPNATITDWEEQNEGGFTANPGTDPGSGTYEEPYELFALGYYAGAKDVWIQGYILESSKDHSSTIIVIGATQDAAFEDGIVVWTTNNGIWKWFDIDSHPELIGQEVMFCGNVIEQFGNLDYPQGVYLSATAFEGGIEPAPGGDGSISYPYEIWQMPSLVEKEGRIIGYVVGAWDGTQVVEWADTNILLADDPDETDPENMFLLTFDYTYRWNYELSLKFNPDMLGRHITINSKILLGGNFPGFRANGTTLVLNANNLPGGFPKEGTENAPLRPVAMPAWYTLDYIKFGTVYVKGYIGGKSTIVPNAIFLVDRPGLPEEDGLAVSLPASIFERNVLDPDLNPDALGADLKFQGYWSPTDDTSLYFGKNGYLNTLTNWSSQQLGEAPGAPPAIWTEAFANRYSGFPSNLTVEQMYETGAGFDHPNPPVVYFQEDLNGTMRFWGNSSKGYALFTNSARFSVSGLDEVLEDKPSYYVDLICRGNYTTVSMEYITVTINGVVQPTENTPISSNSHFYYHVTEKPSTIVIEQADGQNSFILDTVAILAE